MNEIYRGLISERRERTRVRARVYTRVCARGCVSAGGRVQRKTNKAYRIDRRNPEHVRSLAPSLSLSLSLSLSILALLANVPVQPPASSPLPPSLPKTHPRVVRVACAVRVHSSRARG